MRNSQLLTSRYLHRPPSPFLKRVTCLSFFGAFAAVGLLLYFSGERAGHIFLEMILEGFFQEEGRMLSLAKAIPITFAGLSVALAWGSGYYSMSTQGEMLVGLFTAGGFLLLDVPLPAGANVVVALLLGACGGMLFSLASGWVSHFFATSLLLTTLMSNYIVGEVGNYLLYHTEFGRADIFSQGTQHLSLLASVLSLILITFCLYYLKSHHVYGYHIKIRGLNPKFAHYGGVPEEKTLYYTLGLSGAMAGFGGAMVVAMGECASLLPFVQEESFCLQGLTTGLISNYHPMGVLLSGIFFGGFSVGGDYVSQNYGISSSIIPIFQGTVALLVTTDCLQFFGSKKERRV